MTTNDKKTVTLLLTTFDLDGQRYRIAVRRAPDDQCMTIVEHLQLDALGGEAWCVPAGMHDHTLDQLVAIGLFNLAEKDKSPRWTLSDRHAEESSP